jgi:hypothetical protein
MFLQDLWCALSPLKFLHFLPQKHEGASQFATTGGISIGTEFEVVRDRSKAAFESLDLHRQAWRLRPACDLNSLLQKLHTTKNNTKSSRVEVLIVAKYSSPSTQQGSIKILNSTQLLVNQFVKTIRARQRTSARLASSTVNGRSLEQENSAISVEESSHHTNPQKRR